jgi:hypothetical protein
MGIYTGGHIYGVSLRRDEDILFEKIYDSKMNASQIREVEEFYDSLKDKQELTIRFYTSCSTTYITEPNSSMTWLPGNKNLLLTLFATAH